MRIERLGHLLLFLVALPCIALVMLFVLLPLFVFSVSANYLSECRFWRRMRRADRIIHMRDIPALWEGKAGTLIIESPSLGWNYSHAWWTPDDVLAGAPGEVPTWDERMAEYGRRRCHPWDQWCWENYLSPDLGRARLVRVWSGASIEAKLKSIMAELKVVHTWSAPVHWTRNDTEASK